MIEHTACELFIAARAAISEERARLSEMQERLSSLASSTTRTLPLVTVTAPTPHPPDLTTDMRTTLRDQSELLERVHLSRTLGTSSHYHQRQLYGGARVREGGV